ncbi:O-antigen ligase family protein [Roseovarius tibetensis]|uniref:O-antigen ligase family protein n=1 Tax=Roseovarius tibetensis TaxID=2685897 RepID=UPI003D7F3283
MRKGDDVVAETTGHAGTSIGSGISGVPAQDRGRLSIWIWLFVIGLIIPLFIFLGPVRLTVYRVALLAAFFPTVLLWLSGRAGGIRFPDICVVLICLWSSISMVVMDGGLGAIVQPLGILWVETLGAYLLGRCYIRTPEAFHAITRLLFWLAIVLLPFAVFELFTGRNLFLRLFGIVGPVYWENVQDGRLGLERVQGPFAHPIHFGVFFGTLTGMFYFVLGYGKSWLRRVRNALLAVLLCFSSLSAGPLVAAMSQIIFLLWDSIMKSVASRWYIFLGLALVGYFVVDAISDRTPFHVVISYLAFNSATAYNRIHIWNFGVASIFDYPLWGIGLTGDWARPNWMVSSMDMFWIVPAVRHGILVWIGFLALFFSVFLNVVYRSGFGERIQWYRMGYLCTLTGLFVVGWTVHFWHALFAFFMFLLASGMWMLDWEESDETGDDGPVDDTRRKTVPYTRFPAQPAGQDRGA